jgi:hypothetical protein
MSVCDAVLHRSGRNAQRSVELQIRQSKLHPDFDDRQVMHGMIVREHELSPY